jgi:cyclase
MVTIVRDRIRALIDKGMTLEQVKAARPTFDYDGNYHESPGTWTGERFVEEVYKDLSRGKK